HEAVRPRERGRERRAVERERAGGLVVLELASDDLDLGRERVPVVEQALQRAGDAGDGDRSGAIAGDDQQLAVARAILPGGEPHAGRQLSSYSACSMARAAAVRRSGSKVSIITASSLTSRTPMLFS